MSNIFEHDVYTKSHVNSFFQGKSLGYVGLIEKPFILSLPVEKYPTLSLVPVSRKCEALCTAPNFTFTI